MKTRRIAVGAGAVIVAAFAIRSGHPEVSASTKQETERLGARVDQLEQTRRVDDARYAVQFSRNRTSPAPATSEVADEPPPRDGAAQVEHEMSLERARFAELDRLLAAQPIDAAWTEEIRSSLAASFEEARLADVARLGRVECASNRCAVEVQHVPHPDGKKLDGAAMIRWLAQQPCAFAIPGEGFQEAGSSRVYLECPAG